MRYNIQSGNLQTISRQTQSSKLIETTPSSLSKRINNPQPSESTSYSKLKNHILFRIYIYPYTMNLQLFLQNI